MKAAFFIIPGFKQQATDPAFSWLLDDLKKLNLDIIPVPVKWMRRTITQQAEDFKSFYQKHKSDHNFILGFSYGAVITFITASALNPDKVFLCSLSPDFIEDTIAMKKWLQLYIGKKRYQDTKTRSAIKIAKSLNIPTVIFYGDKEGRQYPLLKARCRETSKLAKNAKLVVVKNSLHKIDNPNYIKAIEFEINNL